MNLSEARLAVNSPETHDFKDRRLVSSIIFLFTIYVTWYKVPDFIWPTLVSFVKANLDNLTLTQKLIVFQALLQYVILSLSLTISSISIFKPLLKLVEDGLICFLTFALIASLFIGVTAGFICIFNIGFIKGFICSFTATWTILLIFSIKEEFR